MANAFAVGDRRRWTHVRLSIYPDGGVARFRVHGQVLPDPRFMTGTIDLAAMDNGGTVLASSDDFYSSASNVILPGPARSMSEGWETPAGAGRATTTSSCGSARRATCATSRSTPRTSSATHPAGSS